MLGTKADSDQPGWNPLQHWQALHHTCDPGAVAIASCMARLIPTPPTGDIACAASPMQSKPGLYHLFNRSTVTVSSFTLSRLWISSTLCLRANLAKRERKASRPRALTASAIPLRNDERALPIVAAVEHDQGLSGLDAAEHGVLG